MEFLNTPEIQQAIASIVVLVITALVTALSRALFGFIKSKTTAEQFALLTEIAEKAVQAAESGKLAGFVTDKKATAFNIANEGLASAGIKNLTAEQIDAAIEAAVLREFNAAKAAEASIPQPTDEVVEGSIVAEDVP